jgi:hypothetical protein
VDVLSAHASREIVAGPHLIRIRLFHSSLVRGESRAARCALPALRH